MVCLAHKVFRAYRLPDPKARSDHKGNKVLSEHKVHKAHKDRQSLDRKVYQAMWVRRAFKDPRAHRAHLEHKDQSAFRAHKAHRDPRQAMDHKGHKASLAL